MKILMLIISFFAFILPVQAQEKDTTYKYWVTIGLIGYEGDLALNLSYNFSLAEKFFKVGYLLKCGMMGGLAEDGFLHKSIDISIGDRWQSEWFQSSLFAGPAFIFGEKKNSTGDRENYNTIGVETELQFLFRMANEVGIGLGLYGNLNFQKSFFGFNINFTLGNGK